MKSFLPKGYEALKTEKAYWKMSQMKDGENRLRIVMQPIAGWLDWDEKKPIRYKPECKPAKSFNPEKPIKPFWSCYVWDYARESLFILEITQSSILKSLTLIANDADWGDFTTYDIKINKEGSGKDTRYSLTPLPPKPISPKIEEALKRTPVRLDALYEGRDPWTDFQPLQLNEETGEISPKASNSSIGTPLETLKEHLDIDGIDSSCLEKYVQEIADKKKQPFSQVIEAALMPLLMPKFKATYLKYLSAQQQATHEVAV